MRRACSRCRDVFGSDVRRRTVGEAGGLHAGSSSATRGSWWRRRRWDVVSPDAARLHQRLGCRVRTRARAGRHVCCRAITTPAIGDPRRPSTSPWGHQWLGRDSSRSGPTGMDLERLPVFRHEGAGDATASSARSSEEWFSATMCTATTASSFHVIAHFGRRPSVRPALDELRAARVPVAARGRSPLDRQLDRASYADRVSREVEVVQTGRSRAPGARPDVSAPWRAGVRVIVRPPHV